VKKFNNLSFLPVSVLSIPSPITFTLFMSVILAAICFLWLFICALLLSMPFYTFICNLNFLLGYVIGLFGSSWAFFSLFKPDEKYYITFYNTLVLHYDIAPFLSILHLFFIVALFFWGRLFYVGLISRTSGRINKMVKIILGIIILILVFIILFIIFEDYFTVICAGPDDNTSYSRWIDSFFKKYSVTLTTSYQAASNIATIMSNTEMEGFKMCRSLPEGEYKVCWDMLQHFNRGISKFRAIKSTHNTSCSNRLSNWSTSNHRHCDRPGCA
jgi:hypothetical protein